jgi:hypothetical protein
MATERPSRLCANVLIFVLITGMSAAGIPYHQALAPLRCLLSRSDRASGRDVPMLHDHNHRPPRRQDTHAPQSRFKALRNDPVLLQMEQALKRINRWDDPQVQQQMRLARSGTEAGRQRGLAQLLAVVEEYKAKTIAWQDPCMPYATADQISNSGHGVHVLDQANSGIPLRIEEDVFLLDALILGRQGGGKTSAAANIVSQVSTPVLIIDPKDVWRHRAAALRARVLEITSLDLDPPPGVTWEDWLFEEMEAVAQVTGIQFGLDLLVEASQIALRQRQQYIERTGQDTSLSLKDIKLALPLCNAQKGKRADYRTSAETALSLLIGSERCPLFATRRGLPMEQVLAGRYILPCPHISGGQARFLGSHLFKYMRHSAGNCETTRLRHLTVIDDASKFLTRSDSAFGSGPKFGPWMHVLKILRSSGYGAIFIDQLPESVLDDVKQLCHFWLVVGSIQGRGNQNEVAAAMSLTEAQKQMLGRLQTRECICFCPAGIPKHPFPIHGFIPEVQSPSQEH